MSLLTQFYKELDGYVPKCSFCDRPMSEMCHIMPTGNNKKGGLTTTGKEVAKRLNVSKQIAIDLLDMPLLNTMPCCLYCNGRGMNDSKVCKTDDIIYIDKRVSLITQLLIHDWRFFLDKKTNKIVDIMFVIDNSSLEDIFDCFRIEEDNYIDTIKELKDLQHEYQRLLIGRLA